MKITENVSLKGDSYSWYLFDTKNNIPIKPLGIEKFHGWEEVPPRRIFGIIKNSESSTKWFSYEDIEKMVKIVQNNRG